MMYTEGETPCTTAADRHAATSGADGSFVFDGVAIGTYGVTFKAGPKWTITMGTNFCKGMKEGGTCTIPVMDVNE